MALRRELKVDEWRAEIDSGLKFRREYGLEDDWTKLEAQFYGILDKDSPGPNITASTGDSLLSALTVPYPKIKVIPRRKEFIAGAEVLTALDNFLLDELGIVEQVELACHHAFLWSTGVIKLGYDSEFGYAPEYDIGEGLGTTLTQFDNRENLIENIGTPGMPWARACLPHDIAVPWGTLAINEAPWVFHRIIRHIDEVKSDPKYMNTKELQPNMSQEDFVKSYQTVHKPYRMGENLTRGNTGKTEFVELWEGHVRRSRQVIVIATGHEKFLRKEDDALQLDGQPFVSIGFVPRSRSIWSTPDTFYLRQQQAELDDISLQASKQRRISCLRFLFKQGAMKEEEMTKILSSRVGIAAMVNEAEDLDKVIKVLGDHNNAPLYQDADYVRANAREAVGFSRNQTGEFAGARTTAREVGVVDRASLQRLSRRQTILRRVYIQIFRKLNQSIFAFWGLPRVQAVLGTDGVQKWVQFTGAEIRGEYAYEVSFSDEIIPTRADDERKALEMYFALGQDPNIDQVALREMMSTAFNSPVLKKIFGASQNAPVRAQVSNVSQGQGSPVPNTAQE